MVAIKIHCVLSNGTIRQHTVDKQDTQYVLDGDLLPNSVACGDDVLQELCSRYSSLGTPVHRFLTVTTVTFNGGGLGLGNSDIPWGDVLG